MLDIINDTDFSVGLYSGYSCLGKEQVTVVAKSSFHFDKTGKVTQQAARPIQEADEWLDLPNISSLKAANETVPFKHGGEILLQGSIKLPHPHYHVADVSLSLLRDETKWHKSLRVFGRRRWQRNRWQAYISKSESLEKIQLSYENAYGGKCATKKNKFYALNPAGKGYISRERYCADRELPQIEIRDEYLKHPMQQVSPAGYGPIPLQWSPRSHLVEITAWDDICNGVYPSLISLPIHFYNTAPVDQQFSLPFTGDETIGLQGMMAGIPLNKELQLKIPQQIPTAIIMNSQSRSMLSFVCDTILINTNEARVDLLWRCAIASEENKKIDNYIVVSLGDNCEIK